MMINHNVHPISTYLSGDSAIAPRASAHVATAGVAAIHVQAAHAGAGAGVRKDLTEPPQGGKGNGNKGGGGGNKGHGGKSSASGAVTYLENKRGYTLCKVYQDGSCVAHAGRSTVCPSDKDLRHQCDQCLGLHPATDPACPARQNSTKTKTKRAGRRRKKN